MTTLSQALIAVMAEVERATTKFPTWPTDPFHALAVLGEEKGELDKAVLQYVYEIEKGVTPEDIRAEAIQTAAMAIRFIMSLERYTITSSSRKQHRQGLEGEQDAIAAHESTQ